MRATKLIHKIKKMPYTERLKKLKLPTMKYRRLRGDMIETFKVVHGFYDKLTSIKFEFSHTHLTHFTRGNSFKLDKSHVHYDIRKHFFSNRVTSIWNSLPEEVIVMRTVDSFKNALDKFWSSQEVLYDWKANLAGIGSRSEININKCV
jgi:hypothetical protein